MRPNQPSKAKTQSDWFFTGLICSSLSEVKALRTCPVLEFSTARVTHLKVSGNLNAIQSSVNITDFRLGFHKKKFPYQRKRV